MTNTFTTPKEKLLEAIAAAWFMTFNIFGWIIGPLIIISLIFYSTYMWLFTIMYLIWIWVIDKNIAERGGRRYECIRNWRMWMYLKNYFPVNLKLDEEFQLNPRKNYLFCAFPHGLLSIGVFSCFASRAVEFVKLFPKHKPYMLTLNVGFKLPLYREYLLSLGMCSASVASINWILHSNGGNVGVLMVGGYEEALQSRPGKYTILLQNRKGFVKLALKNGSPLVPVIVFGELETFQRIDNLEGTPFRRFQKTVKRLTGVIPTLFYGNGPLPRRKPINIIVGKPIDVEKISKPLSNDINTLHRKFIVQLMELFERHKYDYIDNPENTYLVCR